MPNCDKANQPLDEKLVAPALAPVEMHWTLLLMLAASAVTVTQNVPPTLTNGMYQYFPWLQLF